MEQLCAVHRRSGPENFIGLGFYKGLRFHVDAKKFRDWGTSGARGGYGCAAVLAEGAAPVHRSAGCRSWRARCQPSAVSHSAACRVARPDAWSASEIGGHYA